MTAPAAGDAQAIADIVDAAAFADLLAGYCLEVEERQQVLVRSTTLAEPLLVELHRAILQRGGWPLMRVEIPRLTRAYYEHAQDWQLDDFPPLALTEARKIDSTVAIQAPEDVRALVGLDPDVLVRGRRARKPISETMMKKRWCSTLWPTASLAEQAGMSLTDFAAFVRGALFLDRPAGPVAAWTELRAFQEHLIGRVGRARTIRIEAAGTDLTLETKGRRWVNSDGKRNMPSGEVFTGPKEDSVEGRIHFDVPSSPAGVEVRGVTLELKAGEVVSARAEVGDEHLQHALRTDDGARRFGELGIGTNFGIDSPIGVILFDEKIGGTVHCALGRSYDETGGKNRSALHWDLICDLRKGGRITADGAVVQEDGRFA